ncbi:DUF2306 domain-containing protein [Aquirufa ecclesiirivi]|uniref:DUF2306 domain-containing protein n=1 Tax=Aquirufa ecclesiirivi TaxID=2715124 RepID=UPI0022A87D3F|nr:DUF2306 domain-containing protein [Aquirufa ecclesiirivi]MCZ2473154.1 DUF2306 domain-containing protein [Aquirufa ecclesiirivi]
MNKVVKSLIYISSALIGIYAFFAYAFLELGNAVHPSMKVNFNAHALGIYAHIFPSIIALILGPFQFNEKFRLNQIQVHRKLGKVYLLCVFLGGFSGLYMAQFSFGGMVSHVGFSLLAILWITSGFYAYSSIVRKKIQAHKNWMVVNFSLTFAAVTLRIGLGIGFAIGLPFELFYPYLAWLCWVPNLLIALLIIKKDTSLQII